MMADESDRLRGAPREKETRQQRLKLALRDNLKRRKSQARERGKMHAAPSSDHEDTLDDET
jgi:hypothetical protein